MNYNDRIYIPPRNPRLGLNMPSYGWRHLGYVLLGCAAVSGLIWWRLSQPNIRRSSASAAELGRVYGVCPGAISNVRSGLSWRHVP